VPSDEHKQSLKIEALCEKGKGKAYLSHGSLRQTENQNRSMKDKEECHVEQKANINLWRETVSVNPRLTDSTSPGS